MKKHSYVLLFLIAIGAFWMPDTEVSVIQENPPAEEGYAAYRAPSIPSDLIATTFGKKAILLQWKDNSDREIAFDVHFVDSQGKEGLRFVDPNVTRHVLNDLKPSTEYHIRVRARGPYGHSEFSPAVTLKTKGGKDFMVAFD